MILKSLYIRKFAYFVCLLAVFGCPATYADRPQSITLTILHTNDVHGHLFPFDYDTLGADEVSVGGAARRASLIRQIKSSANHPVLVMDAGDIFMRGPISDLEGAPDMEIMNAVPYDVMTFGNNEFKGNEAANLPRPDGRRIIINCIKQVKFSVLSANVVDLATGKPVVQPYKIFDYDGVKVGVFGLTTPRDFRHPEDWGMNAKDPVATAKEMVSELQGKCDLIVALTHVGFPYDLMLASLVPQIDVIIGGDSHTWLFRPMVIKRSNSNQGVIVCQDGEWGKCVGRLDLTLHLSNSDHYEVTNYSDQLLPVNSSIKPASDIEDIINRYAGVYYKKIGRLSTAVPKSEAAAWVAERMRRAAKADIGVEPEEAIENGLKAGDVTVLDVRGMFPWLNHVVKLKVTGKQLREYVSSTDCGLAGAKVMNGKIYLGKNPISNSKIYSLAIEDYYAGSSSSFKGVKPVELGMTTRDIIVRSFSLH